MSYTNSTSWWILVKLGNIRKISLEKILEILENLGRDKA